MKHILLLILLAPVMAVAQNKALIVEGTAPALYINHTVEPKENFYSVGRMYNISPKEIAPFNGLDLEKGLNLGQVIKVPLTAANFSQDAVVDNDEVLVPVYHVVRDKEGLYRIATNFNKLPLQTLKQWNNISGEAVNSGTKLVVGYLRVKKELSPLASMAKHVTPVAKNTEPARTPVQPEVSNETLPVVKKPELEKKPEAQPVKEKEPVVETVKTEPPAVKQEEKAPQAVQPRAAKNFNGGFFKNMYNDQVRGADKQDENGTVAVFKSTSGWDDGKYYCLHNSAAPGTIVKVTSNKTGKSVYAKVLDIMPDIRQNNGVLIRLSNAAAAELGEEDSRFDCTLSFARL